MHLDEHSLPFIHVSKSTEHLIHRQDRIGAFVNWNIDSVSRKMGCIAAKYSRTMYPRIIDRYLPHYI
ncbi:hypothetical protein BH10ACI3_BH10ACI3_16810 [soil metagenome]